MRTISDKVHQPVIRVATQNDAEIIAVLAGQLGYPGTPDQARDRLMLLSSSERDVVMVAEQEGAVVGWIHVGIRDTLEAAQYAEILGLVVDERFRSRGIGGHLVRCGEEWALEHGQKRIRVRSNLLRGQTHRFYERLEYAETKRQVVLDKSL